MRGAHYEVIGAANWPGFALHVNPAASATLIPRQCRPHVNLSKSLATSLVRRRLEEVCTFV